MIVCLGLGVVVVVSDTPNQLNTQEDMRAFRLLARNNNNLLIVLT